MNFEGEQVYYTDQNLLNTELQPNNEKYSLAEAELKFMHFLKETQENNIFIYREQLKNNALRGNHFFRFDMGLLDAFDQQLAKNFREYPLDHIKTFERAVQVVYRNEIFDQNNPDMEESPKFQVQVHSEENPQMLRGLQSNLITKLVCVPGIITSTSKATIRTRTAVWKCSSCGHEKVETVGFGLRRVMAPEYCDNSTRPGPDKQSCGLRTYRLDHDKSEYFDQQIMKLQEAPELIPTGEMPRSVMVCVDRYLTDTCTPGNRVKLMGVLDVTKPGNSNSDASTSRQPQQKIAKPYIRVYGIMPMVNDDMSFTGFSQPNITMDDQEKFEQMKRDPEIYENLCKSIAPSIFGHADIKKAIACLLFGGCPKKLPDGMKLRGDINVLLLGDPSVAKSQFLKFVDRVAPISVYTSGKGSSAAGLTASVLRDPATGDFQLEGGAMVLADGGIVCIDEFDKMRPQDRVAIHEAMEQQTISIAKAGITTILNSRTSVLAAANPLFGRYDDLKHASEQIDFQSTILSRFDTIFIVRDIRQDAVDKAIASHVLGLHMHHQQREQEGEIPLDVLRKYVCYARSKIQPKLTEEACHMLQNLYVTDRSASKNQRISKKTNGIPITVRQLEAIIRLSEAIAKMHLDSSVQIKHVQESHRLFKVSTLNAAASGMSSAKGMDTPAELSQMVMKIEEAVKRRVAIGTKISHIKLQQEMLMRFDNQRAIDHAIIAMVKKGDFMYQEARKILCRQMGSIA